MARSHSAGFPPECKPEVRWMFVHLDTDADGLLSAANLYALREYLPSSYDGRLQKLRSLTVSALCRRSRRARALPAPVPGFVRRQRGRECDARRVVRLPAARGAALHGAGACARRRGRARRLRAGVRCARLLPATPVPRGTRRVLVR